MLIELIAVIGLVSSNHSVVFLALSRNGQHHHVLIL